MTLPMLYAIAEAHPEDSFTLLTQPFLTSMLFNSPQNLEAMAIDIKHEEKRLWGLMRYATRLGNEPFDMVIDLHDVLRSKYIRWMLGLRGIKNIHIRKPRKERKQLIARPPHKICAPIPTMLSVYKDAFERAGISVPDKLCTMKVSSDINIVIQHLYPEYKAWSQRPWVGIAPFAAHESKMYYLSKMENVVAALGEGDECQVFLFGAKGKEKEVLDQWARKYNNVFSLAGKLSLSEELAIIERLECMVSMDSANMHLASLVGTRCISVWCATHPYAGFLGYGQRLEDCIQIDDLECRPCSIFGNKKCYRHDYACKKGIQPSDILNKVQDILKEEKSTKIKE